MHGTWKLVILTLALALPLTVGAQETDSIAAPPHAGASMHHHHARPVLRGGRRIAAVGEDGTTITLEDGTVWEVYLPDRPKTDGWKKGDFVLVRQRAASVNDGEGIYEYVLINGRDNTRATVRVSGREDDGT